MTDHSWAELLPAYALDALDAADARALESHLASCAACREELAALRETVAAIAETAPRVEPPAALRERVLSQATARAREQAAGSAAAASVSPRATTLAPARAVRPWQWLAAACGLLAVASGVGLLRSVSDVAALRATLARATADLSSQGAALAERDSLLARVLGPDVEIATLAATGSAPSLRLYRDRSRNAMVIVARRLPPAAAGRTYQLWGIGTGGTPVGLGTFNPGADGNAVVVLEVAAEARFTLSAVTDEPTGGSAAPTTQPFLVGSWPTAGSQ